MTAWVYKIEAWDKIGNEVFHLGGFFLLESDKFQDGAMELCSRMEKDKIEIIALEQLVPYEFTDAGWVWFDKGIDAFQSALNEMG